MKSHQERAFTVVELVVVIALIAVLFVLLRPTHGNPGPRVKRINCANTLRHIGVVFKTWALDNTNAFPMNLPASNGGARELTEAGSVAAAWRVLSNELSTAWFLTCPADTRQLARGFINLSNTNISYFVGLDAVDSNPQTFLAGDRNITNGTPLPPNRILVLPTNSMAGWTHEMHNCQGNVLLADGSVQQVSSSRLRWLLSESAVTNRVAIP